MCSKEKNKWQITPQIVYGYFLNIFIEKIIKKNIMLFFTNFSIEKIQFLFFRFSFRFFIQIECNDLEKHDQAYWYCHKMRLPKVNSSDDQFDARAFRTHHIDLFHLTRFAFFLFVFPLLS